MIDELFLYERFEAFGQSDEEEQEVREYALRNGLETWVPGGMDTVCCVKFGQDDYSIPNPPIVPSFSSALGMLTHALFLNLRRPGWKEKDDLQALHNEEIIGLPEDEQRLLRDELEARWGPITRVAREQQKAEYARQAARLLNGDLIIDELATRVRELREQLEQEADLLRLWHGELLSDWFRAAFVIQDGKGELSEEKPTAGRTHLDRFVSSVREGLPPARTLFEAERVFRNVLNTPEVVTKAQLAGLTYLLAEREPILRHAAKVRDKLAIYQPLLRCAALDMPPLSPAALEALRETLENVEPKVQYSKRDPFVPFYDEIARIYSEIYDSHSFDSKRYEDVSKRFGDAHADEFEEKYGDRTRAYPSPSTVRGIVERPKNND